MARIDKLTAGDMPDTGTNLSPKGAGKKPYAKKRGATTIIDTPSMVPPKNSNQDARIHAELISKGGRHTGHRRKGR